MCLQQLETYLRNKYGKTIRKKVLKYATKKLKQTKRMLRTAYRNNMHNDILKFKSKANEISIEIIKFHATSSSSFTIEWHHQKAGNKIDKRKATKSEIEIKRSKCLPLTSAEHTLISNVYDKYYSPNKSIGTKIPINLHIKTRIP